MAPIPQILPGTCGREAPALAPARDSHPPSMSLYQDISPPWAVRPVCLGQGNTCSPFKSPAPASGPQEAFSPARMLIERASAFHGTLLWAGAVLCPSHPSSCLILKVLEVRCDYFHSTNGI